MSSSALKRYSSLLLDRVFVGMVDKKVFVVRSQVVGLRKAALFTLVIGPLESDIPIAVIVVISDTIISFRYYCNDKLHHRMKYGTLEALC